MPETAGIQKLVKNSPRFPGHIACEGSGHGRSHWKTVSGLNSRGWTEPPLLLHAVTGEHYVFPWDVTAGMCAASRTAPSRTAARGGAAAVGG